jgi:hypothetical protein
MAAKLTRLTRKIAMQLHILAESYTICSSRSRRPVRKLLDTTSYAVQCVWCCYMIEKGSRNVLQIWARIKNISS